MFYCHSLNKILIFPFLIFLTNFQIRGIRSKIGNNECLLCCVDFLFHIVETLVRFFNKYAYVQVSDRCFIFVEVLIISCQCQNCPCSMCLPLYHLCSELIEL